MLQPISAGPDLVLNCGQSVELGACPLPYLSGATYSWSPTTDLSGANTANPTLTGSNSTPSQYVLTVTMPNGQIVQSMVNVNVLVTPITIVPDHAEPYCAGSTLTLTTSGYGAPASYVWASSADPSFQATGTSITVNLMAGPTTYTVTTPCGSTGFDVTSTDCCLIDMYATAPFARTVYTIAGGTYYLNPFDKGPGATYFLNGPLVLTDNLDLFRLDPGSEVLLAANGRIELENAAVLQLNGAKLTAACADMWDGIYVHRDAGGVQTYDPEAADELRSTVEHSLNGLLFEEPDPSRTTPFFRLKHVDFRQNYQSVLLERVDVAATADDWIRDCTFDSNPPDFKEPVRGMGAGRYYSQWHVRLSGDVRLGSWTDNLFAHAMAGIITPHTYYGWFDLENSVFRYCFVAGITSEGPAISTHAPYGDLEVRLDQDKFYLPDFYPGAGQQGSIPLVRGGGICYGAMLSTAQTAVTNCLFEQTDALASQGYNDFETNFGSAQVGLLSDCLHKGEDNAFTRLSTGIELGLQDRLQATVRGNTFTDCQRGVRVQQGLGFNMALPGGPPTLWTTCNSFLPDATRSDLSVGLQLEGPVGLKLEDLSDPTLPLKDLFYPNGRTPGDFLAIYDRAGLGVTYNTFNHKVTDYQQYSQGNVAINGLGTLTPSDNSTGFGPCSTEAPPYPTGIQNRAASNTPGGVGLTSQGRIEQNVPNPCSGSTTLNYALPPGTRQAGMLVRRSLDGSMVEQVELKPTATQHILNLRKYTPGVYFYTLTVDGVPVQTKRMLIE